jgi:hypothetical protein
LHRSHPATLAESDESFAAAAAYFIGEQLLGHRDRSIKVTWE